MGIQLQAENKEQQICNQLCIYRKISTRERTPSKSPDDFIVRHCSPQRLATCWELLIVAFFSLITTSYTLHNEIRLKNSGDAASSKLAFDPGYFTFIFDPSPVGLIIACVGQGCAITSFTYRRQTKDRFQAPIFILSITAATIFCLAWGISANILLLAVFPWTVWTAMVGSAMIHWIYRRCAMAVYHKVYVYDVGGKGVITERWVAGSKGKCSCV